MNNTKTGASISPRTPPSHTHKQSQFNTLIEASLFKKVISCNVVDPERWIPCYERGPRKHEFDENRTIQICAMLRVYSARSDASKGSFQGFLEGKDEGKRKMIAANVTFDRPLERHSKKAKQFGSMFCAQMGRRLRGRFLVCCTEGTQTGSHQKRSINRTEIKMNRRGVCDPCSR